MDFKLGSVVPYYKRMDGIDFGVPPFFRLENRGQKGAKNAISWFVSTITKVLIIQLLCNLAVMFGTIKGWMGLILGSPFFSFRN